MDKKQIEQKVINFIEENFFFNIEDSDKTDEIKMVSCLEDAGILDSTGVLELVSWIEEEFKIEVENAEIIPANLGNVNKITEYIHGKLP